MQTAEIAITSEDAIELRRYDIFDRYRNGESIHDIAVACGLPPAKVIEELKQLADWARKNNKELSDLALAKVAARYEWLWNYMYKYIDETRDNELKLKAAALMANMNQKVTDLFQIGRATKSTEHIIISGQASDIEIAKTLGIPVPKDF